MGSNDSQYETRPAEVSVDRESLLRVLRLLAASLVAECDGVTMDYPAMTDAAIVEVMVDGIESENWWMVVNGLSPGPIGGAVVLVSILGDPNDYVHQAVVATLYRDSSTHDLEIKPEQKVAFGFDFDWTPRLLL